MSKYTESTQIEQPAIALFEELEWRTYIAYDKALGKDSPLSRKGAGQVVQEQILRDKLHVLNEDIPEEPLDEAIREITRDRSSLHPVRANQQVYQLLRDGMDEQHQDTTGMIRAIKEEWH